MVSLIKTRMWVLAAITLLLLARISAMADDKAVGKELIEKARKVSDISADGSPAFRMEGAFRIIRKKGGQEVDGSYSEIWVSKTKWRRQAQMGSISNVELRVGSKSWVTGSQELFTSLTHRLTLLPETFPRDVAEITGLSERQVNSVRASCVKSKSRLSKGIDCVDPSSGVLLLQETSSRNNYSPSDHSCVYLNYEKFGEHLFPRLIRCQDIPGEDVELTILKLVVEPSPDEALFARPPDALEYGSCQTIVTAPKAVSTPDPAYPGHRTENFNATVILWTIIGEDGSPRGSRVARSIGPDFDQAALNALQQWSFRPATCDGLPIAVPINIEMTFRKF